MDAPGDQRHSGSVGAAAPAKLDLLGEPDQLRLALSPVRRRLLALLREPASATQLAARLGLGRQRVAYHLRELERAGLLELVEERKRRGCVERILRASADTFVIDPAVLGAPASVEAQDRFAADHLVETASGVVRDVTRMQAAARRDGKRLLTFTVEAELGFAAPADVERFCDRLADLVRETAHELGSPTGRRYRVVIGGHPTPIEGDAS